MKFKIPPENSRKLKKFLKSNLYLSKSKENYSSYWDLHSKKMNIKFHDDGVDISGDSGFYIPNTIFSKIKKNIHNPSKIVYKIKQIYEDLFSLPKFIKWSDGFNAVMQGDLITDPDLSPYRINHNQLALKNKGIIKNIIELYDFHKKNFKFPINNQIIIAYYFRNLLISFINKKPNDVLEIGGGNGNFMSILLSTFNQKNTYMIDLPESIVNAFIFLSSNFPNFEILLPDEIEEISSENKYNEDVQKIFFLTPQQVNLIPESTIDISINTHSFQEMNHMQIKKYFNMVQKISKNKGLFFCANRVEKIPTSELSYVEIQNSKPNRFYEYPWHKKNNMLIDEISRLHRICMADNVGIRLQEIVNNEE